MDFGMGFTALGRQDVYALVIAFVLGSLPFGYWLTRLKSGIDIRNTGSGNMGATNVARTQGASLGLTVLALDIAKGVAAVFVGQALAQPGVMWLAGFLAIAGHCFSPFMKFSGGKGVATALGVFATLAPWATGGALGVFVLVLALFRWVSLASMSSAIAFSLLVIFHPLLPAYPSGAALWGLVCGLLIVGRHHSNIRKLLNGTEDKLGQKDASEENPMLSDQEDPAHG